MAMDDFNVPLDLFREPVVAYPVCVRAEPGLLRREELTTYHAHAAPLSIALADDGTVMIHLQDGRTITIGTSSMVTYCQCAVDIAIYRDGKWEMPGGMAEYIAGEFKDDETDVILPAADC